MTGMQSQQTPLLAPMVGSSPYLAAAAQQIQPVQGAGVPQAISGTQIANLLNQAQTRASQQQQNSASTVPAPGGGYGPLAGSSTGTPPLQGALSGVVGNWPGPNNMGGSGVEGTLGGAWQGLQSLFTPQSTTTPTNPAAQTQASQSMPSNPPPGALAAMLGGAPSGQAAMNSAPQLQQALLAQSFGNAS